MYQLMLYGGFSLAGLLLIAAVVLFLKLHIAAVIGDVTGVTRKKQIKQIQQEGAQGEQDNYYSQAVGLKRSGTLRPHSGKLEKKSRSSQLFGRGRTGKTGTVTAETAYTPERELTSNPGDPVPEETTEQLASQTEVLVEEDNATELLTEKEKTPAEAITFGEPAEGFEILTQVISIHSDERIE